MIAYAFYKAFEAPRADWTDRLIAKWTKGPYSHVEIIIDGYMYSSSPRDGGVRRKKHRVDMTTWDYILIPENQINEKIILDFFKMTNNAKYDWLGIAGFVIPVHDNEQKYFCSEWTSKAGALAGIKCLYNKNFARLSPNKLARVLKEEGKYESIGES